MFKKFGLLVFLFFSGSLFGQRDQFQFEFVSLGQENSHSPVYCICQDRRGFIWLGTDDGLKRFDGYQLKVFKFELKNPHSLSNNEVWSLYEDHHGHLWIGTIGGGLDRFDSEKEQFIHYQNDPKNPNSLSSNFVRCIYEDRSGRLWIGTDDGLNRFVSEGTEGSPSVFVRYQNDPKNPNSLSHNRVYSIYEDRSGIFWIGTWGGGLNRLVQKDDSTQIFLRYQHDSTNPTSLSHDRIWSICEDRFGELWIGTDGGGLNRFNRQKNSLCIIDPI